MPRITRPPERWSIVRYMSASRSGLRYELQVTISPTSARVVVTAIAVSRVMPSK
jgi:hypothetical protein